MEEENWILFLWFISCVLRGLRIKSRINKKFSTFTDSRQNHFYIQLATLSRYIQMKKTEQCQNMYWFWSTYISCVKDMDCVWITTQFWISFYEQAQWSWRCSTLQRQWATTILSHLFVERIMIACNTSTHTHNMYRIYLIKARIYGLYRSTNGWIESVQ